MSYFVCRETVIVGEIVRIGPFATESEARMTLANEVEMIYEDDMSLSCRDIQAEVNEAVRTGSREITNAVGNVIFAFTLEQL